VQGVQVTAVGGSWVVPAVSSTPANADSGVWVGIDGWGNGTVEQIGTEERVSNGQASYDAWVELFGDQNAQGQKGPYYDPYQIPLAINPHDTILARVAYVGANNFRFDIQDDPANGGTPQAWGVTLAPQYVVPQRSTAEWIVEAPGIPELTLANFGSVSFKGAWATVGGVTGPINVFPSNTTINMADPYGGFAATSNPPQDVGMAGPYESGVAASSSFTVTYKATPNGPVPLLGGRSGSTGTASAHSDRTDISPRASAAPSMVPGQPTDWEIQMGRCYPGNSQQGSVPFQTVSHCDPPPERPNTLATQVRVLLSFNEAMLAHRQAEAVQSRKAGHDTPSSTATQSDDVSEA
jgi:hypothetical protein